jgi:hypothetical protein
MLWKEFTHAQDRDQFTSELSPYQKLPICDGLVRLAGKLPKESLMGAFGKAFDRLEKKPDERFINLRIIAGLLGRMATLDQALLWDRFNRVSPVITDKERQMVLSDALRDVPAEKLEPLLDRAIQSFSGKQTKTPVGSLSLFAPLPLARRLDRAEILIRADPSLATQTYMIASVLGRGSPSESDATLLGEADNLGFRGRTILAQLKPPESRRPPVSPWEYLQSAVNPSP